MAFTVKYDGNFLTDHMRIIDVHRNLGAGITSTTEENVFSGTDFVRSRRDKSTIEVEFRTFDNITTARRLLAKLTSSSIPAELIFSDEPNLYYQAIRQGEITLTESKSKLFATGTITFLIPAGEAESVDTKVLNESNSGGEFGTITHNADGSTKIQINNQGTLPTWVKLNLTSKHDNGYFGIVGVKGAMEFGKREEADGVTIQHSDVLYDSKTDPKFSKFVSAAGKPHPEWTGAGTNGTIGYQEYNYKSSNGQQKTMKGVKLIDPGSQTGFRGGMTELVLPPDSNGDSGAVNFYAWFRLFTWTTALGQTGVMQILFTDENDEFVAGYGTLKDDKTGNIGTVGFWIGGPNKGQWKHIPYVANNGEQTGLKDNNTMLNDNRGQLDFAKQGATLGFYWKGGHQTIVVPELKDVAIHKVKFFFGNWSTNPRGTMTHMVIRDFWCRKDFVNTWNDLPNRYKNGSTLEIDMERGQITKDGILANNELVTGSEFFSIPPGVSEIDIYQSSWNTTSPDVSIEWKERYL